MDNPLSDERRSLIFNMNTFTGMRCFLNCSNRGDSNVNRFSSAFFTYGNANSEESTLTIAITTACIWIIANASSNSLESAVQETDEPGTKVKTDEWKGYNGLADRGYEREPFGRPKVSAKISCPCAIDLEGPCIQYHPKMSWNTFV